MLLKTNRVHHLLLKGEEPLNKKLKIFRIKVKNNASLLPAGKIEIINFKELIVHSADKMISILEIQQEGKKRLSIQDFLKGSNIKNGEYFS